MNPIFYLKSDILPHISYLGQTVTPENWKHFHRKNTEYILYFIASGEMYMNENGIEYPLKLGDIILLEPGYEQIGYKPAKCTYYFVHFNPATFSRQCIETKEEIQNMIRTALHSNYTAPSISESHYTDTFITIPKYMHIDNPQTFSQITQQIISAIQREQTRHMYYKSISSGHIVEMLSLYSSYWMLHAYDHSPSSSSTAMYDKINELLDYFHSSYQQKITSTSIEQLLSVNFDYLNRIFKKQTGSTIFSYLNRYRLEHAMQLLLTTTLPLNEVAEKTGFSDEYYFNRVFKKHIGITPAKYRKSGNSIGTVQYKKPCR